MKVYKYYNKKYKTALGIGMFQLNTFDNIRNADNSGAIYDSSEGVTRNRSGNLFIKDPNDPRTKSTVSDLEPLGAIKFGPNARDTTIINLTAHSILPNAYMFCVTKERNDAYWSRIAEVYDGCIEISNFKEFSERILSALINQGLNCDCLCRECFYEPNEGDISSGTTKFPDYFRKPLQKTYQEQKEVRAVFIPYSSGIKIERRSICVNVGDIVKFIN